MNTLSTPQINSNFTTSKDIVLVFRGSFGDIMDINVFATDMDGAFLTDANDYDRQRFAHVFEVLQAQGKRFVAISGNQSTKSKDFSKTTLTR